MNEELDSQLSAMFDDELPAAECELLARRLSRDEQLKARWGRYAAIGATIRAERGVRLNGALAWKVNAAILAEPALGATAAPQRAPGSGGWRWRQGVAGVAVAAGVAAVSILWLRGQAPLPTVAVAARQALPPQVLAATPAALSSTAGPPGSYVVPRTPAVRPVVVPITELANYVVAHSAVSSPVARRNLLSAFMTSEAGAAGTEEPLEAARSNAQ
ncbi:MAG TPA: sigma-E factor negative regulatory protein [Steroidobacteraceae bacterium]|jgi:negative regulator of sigma E activity|nr:sigma-E factor negative regulatory protein [Steroidobacteraceae bacterium]